MLNSWISRISAATVVLTVVLIARTVPAGLARPMPPEIDPAVALIMAPDQIHWNRIGNGEEEAVLVGDPNKAGLYVTLVRWTAHHGGPAHFHPNDRYIVVLSGTWWVGTGQSNDPQNMVPVKAGSFVRYYANQIHNDGAKDEDTILEVVGQGPATGLPALPVLPWPL
jgi:quercetin dioxygenase-like cupin family protein